MPKVPVRLLKTTRVEGEHTEAGTIVELEGRDRRTGELVGDARYMVSRGFAEEVTADDAAEALEGGAPASGRRRGRKGDGAGDGE